MIASGRPFWRSFRPLRRSYVERSSSPVCCPYPPRTAGYPDISKPALAAEF